MRNLFIFGIGGTGSRVIRSLQMLLATNAGKFKSVTSGGIVNETTIFPIIIDFDEKNGDKNRTVAALEKYKRLNEAIYSSVTFNKVHPEDGFFSTKIREMKDVLKGGTCTFNRKYNPNDEDKRYSDSIGYGTMDGNLNDTRELLGLLYNNSLNQEFAELHIDTTVGFRGNPNIGSVMLNDIEHTKEFQEFCSLCNSNEDDRVVIIGSLFGGTGAAGIPVLVNAIRNNVRPSIRDVKISTVLVCPYFKIGQPKDDERNEGVIDDKIFESKTKAALHFYKDLLNNQASRFKIDSIYYVGDTTKSNVEHHIGKEKQENPANIVELISALSILHFSGMATADFNNPGSNEWKYGLKVDIDNSEGNTASNLDFQAFADENLDDIKKMIAYVIACRVVNEYIITNARHSKDKNYYRLSGLGIGGADKNQAEKKFSSTLQEFLEYFDEFKKWATELNMGNGHKLISFDFDSKELCDVTIGHEFRKEKGSLIGRGKKVSKSTLDPIDDVLAAMSADFKTEHQVEGKVTAPIQEGDTIDYAFFRSLYTACQKVVNQKFKF